MDFKLSYFYKGYVTHLTNSQYLLIFYKSVYI